MKKLIALIALTFIMVGPVVFAEEPKYTLTESQLTQLISDAVEKAVTSAVAIAVKEKEDIIIDKDKTIALLNIKIDALTTANNLLSINYDTAMGIIDKLKADEWWKYSLTGLGGSAVGFGLGYLTFGLGK